MAVFLNTKRLNHWIPQVIKEAKKEVVLIVPYISISRNILKALQDADKRGVQIFLIYRENKLSTEEREKLKSISNINLLCHPNIHCKTYYNGEILVISSMNLYEYSEKNNREMGVLATVPEYEPLQELDYFDNFFSEDEDLIIDATQEIREIINGAQLEKMSEKSKASKFNIDIIKSFEQLEQELCIKLNTYYLNKKFRPIEIEKDLWYSICENYYDNVNVTFEDNRIAVKFKMHPSELSKVYNIWMRTYQEFEFDWFKYYWNYYKDDLLIYKNSKFNWNSIKEDEIYYAKINQMLTFIIKKYRLISGK